MDEEQIRVFVRKPYKREFKMSDHNTCWLCQNSSELRESHIIPDCIFRLIRDESLAQRFYELHDKTDSIIQDGPKEYLLCGSCEQKISQYEKYFKEAIHFSRHGVKISHNDRVAIIDNLDYKKTKLFFLSLLWRMSISSLPQFQIVRADDSEDIIRGMIEREEPGKSSEFSVSGIIPLINQKMQEEWTTTAFMSRRPQAIVYRIVIGGILYSISTASQNCAYPAELLLNDSGRWIMPLTDISRIPFLWEYICQHFNK